MPQHWSSVLFLSPFVVLLLIFIDKSLWTEWSIFGCQAMLSTVSKTLIRNVIRHVDSHNKVVEETDMWRSREKERQGNESSGYSFLQDRRADMRYEFSNSRSRRAHMDDDDDDGKDKKRSTYWMQQLYKAEEQDTERWGHAGYKEMYPDEFRPRRSDSESEKDRRNKSRKRKRAHKSGRRKHKKARSHSTDSESDTQHKDRENGRRKPHRKRHRSTSSSSSESGDAQDRFSKHGNDRFKQRHSEINADSDHRLGREKVKRKRSVSQSSDSSASETKTRTKKSRKSKKKRKRYSSNSDSNSDYEMEREKKRKKKEKKRKKKKHKQSRGHEDD